MNAINMARTAYQTSAHSVRTPRATEYDAFARITRRLKQASDTGKFADLAAAIHDNRTLWTILAVDVASEANALPPPLRAQIFYLAEFTDQHSSKVLSGDANAEVLVDINTSIMAGLRQTEIGS